MGRVTVGLVVRSAEAAAAELPADPQAGHGLILLYGQPALKVSLVLGPQAAPAGRGQAPGRVRHGPELVIPGR